ncbi:hypothetical protein PM082_024779 [Marasmius tenuissimus]|nr:hypothetical protein PM082_024779 [Marasmius tenuissimus]
MILALLDLQLSNSTLNYPKSLPDTDGARSELDQIQFYDEGANPNLVDFIYRGEFLAQGITVTSNLLTDVILGIASTLIIVRSALGIAINDERSFRMTVLGENGETQGMIESVVEFRRRDESSIMGDAAEEHFGQQRVDQK